MRDRSSEAVFGVGLRACSGVSQFARLMDGLRVRLLVGLLLMVCSLVRFFNRFFAYSLDRLFACALACLFVWSRLACRFVCLVARLLDWPFARVLVCSFACVCVMFNYSRVLVRSFD